MIDSESLKFDDTVHADVVRHWALLAAALENAFGPIPVWWALWPGGFANAASYHKQLDAVPASIATVAVTTTSGTHSYLALRASAVEWATHAKFATAFYSWTCKPERPSSAAYGRVNFAPSGSASNARLREALNTARTALTRLGFDAFAMLDGSRGATLWIPFANGPAVDDVRATLTSFARDLEAHAPSLVTTAPHPKDRGDRIFVSARSNAAGNGTLLPFSPIGTSDLAIATPASLADAIAGDVEFASLATFARNARSRIEEFERLRAATHAATFSRSIALGVDRESVVLERLLAEGAPVHDSRSYLVNAALTVLADGKEHGADEILARGQELGLIAKSATVKYVYTALREYVLRTLGAHRVPALVQIEGTSLFRLNRPADPWPDVELPKPPRWIADAEIQRLSAQLRTTATGLDPTAFELAIRDAVAALGFDATHYGGNGEPDVIAGAALGVIGYRVVIECKTAGPGANVSKPQRIEAAKFREAFGATLSMLVGPQFGNDAALDEELATHGVSLWTVDDIVRALEENLDPLEIQSALAPGRAASALDAILWERAHGRPKRIAVIADLLQRKAWTMQMTLAKGVALGAVPSLNVEALLLLVDDALVANGVEAGASREDFDAGLQAAIGAGSLVGDGKGGYVARRPTGRA
jgi:DNA primase